METPEWLSSVIRFIIIVGGSITVILGISAFIYLLIT